MRRVFLIFQKSVVGAKIRRALFITTDALFPTLSSREERVKLRRVVVFVRLFLWLLRRVKKEEQRLQIFKCHNPARCASHRRNHHHPLVNECGRPRPGNERGSNKRRRKRRPRVVRSRRVRWVKKAQKRISRTNRVTLVKRRV